jgi:hypothetical protein
VLVQLDDNKLTDIELPEDRAGAIAEFDAAPVQRAPVAIPRRGSAIPAAALGAGRVPAHARREAGPPGGAAARAQAHRPQAGPARPRRAAGTPRAKFLIDSLVTEIQAVNPHVVLIYVPNVDYFDSPARVSYPLRRAWFQELAAQRGLSLVDPSDAFLESYRATGEPLHGFSNTQPGQGHVNARGHALMANELVTVLRREDSCGGRAMIFSSTEFLLFLLGVLLLTRVLPSENARRNLLLPPAVSSTAGGTGGSRS